MSRAYEIILQDLGRLGNWYLFPAAGTGRPPDRVPAAGTGYYDTLSPFPAAGTGRPPDRPGCRDRIQDEFYFNMEQRLKLHTYKSNIIDNMQHKHILLASKAKHASTSQVKIRGYIKPNEVIKR